MLYNKKMKKQKLRHVLWSRKQEFFSRLLICILTAALIFVLNYNVKSIMRVKNMYDYDIYLNGLYDLKEEKGLAALKEINNDLFAYIEIEDLDIHLPIVKTESNAGEDYYLSHDFKNDANELGTPYQKHTTMLGETTNTVFIGHSSFTENLFNLKKNTSIFGALNKYLIYNPNYNYTISVETLNNKYIFKVMGVILFNVNRENTEQLKIYNTININSQASFDNFYGLVQKHSIVGCLETATYGDRFLTLFTCNSNLENRVMVIAKQVA